MSSQRIAVLGMGTMGRGIAEVLLASGFEVSCTDISQEIVDSSTGKLRDSLQKSYEKGKIGRSAEDLLRGLRTGVGYEIVRGLSFAIEAVPENSQEKEKALKAAEELLDPNAVIATNTSSLSVTKLSNSLKDPSNLVGLHFFNPAPRMPLVEVVRGEKTSERALTQCMDLAKALGKTPVIVKDSPGFVVNRLLIPYLVEAGRLLDQGVASPKDIDTCMKLGAGYPMGPFELSDLIGIDVVVEIAEALRAAGRTSGSEAIPAAFKSRLAQGRLGRKTKGGFYEY